MCRPYKALLAAFMIASLAGATPAAAGTSGLAALLGEPAGSQARAAEPEALLSRASESFRTAAEELARGHVGPAGLPEERLAGLVSSETRHFEEAARQRLGELQGDGALTLEESTRALAQLREQHLAALEERAKAAAAGVSAPPLRSEATPFHRYLGELLAYTLLVRNPPSAWLLLLGGIVAGIGLAGLLSFGLGRLAARLRHGRRRLAADLLGTLRGPLYLTATLLGVATGLDWVWMPVPVEDFVWTLIQMSFAASLLWLTWNVCGVVGTLVGWAAERTGSKLDDQMVELVRKGLRLFSLVVFVLLVAEVLFEADLKGLLAGLGILGLAVSLAAQDTLKNLMASFTIYGDKPFRVGDLVRYDGHFGPIEEIGFRSTRLRTLDGHLVTVPNADLIRQPVENVGARPWIRRRFRIDLPYETPPETVREALRIVEEAILEGGEREQRDPHVVLEAFGDYSLRMLVQYRYTPPDYWEALSHATEVHLRILERFADAGIEFAFPTQTVHVGAAGETLDDEADAEEQLEHAVAS